METPACFIYVRMHANLSVQRLHVPIVRITFGKDIEQNAMGNKKEPNRSFTACRIDVFREIKTNSRKKQRT